MPGTAEFPMVVVGLIGLLFLSGGIGLASRGRRGIEEGEWLLMVFSAGGLAATALFSLLLIHRLVVQIVQIA